MFDVTQVLYYDITTNCLDNMCGYDCTKKCYCSEKHVSVEDRMLGTCSSGCTGRWTGVDEKCDTECTGQEWGQSCQSQCGSCYESAPCDVRTGTCPAGCGGGFTNTPACKTECTDGLYGRNCTYSCSGQCIHNEVCRKTDGHCVNGCSPGFTELKCNQQCAGGYYGVGCSKSCGENCRAGGSVCDHVDGTCLQGCIAGLKGYNCDIECDFGKWGVDCVNPCGQCSNGLTCSSADGLCSDGCMPGYKNTAECKDECPQGKYGKNCTGTCSNLCVAPGSCINVDGNCNGCQPGWQGSLCDQASTQQDFGVAAVAGGISATVVIVTVLVAVFQFLRIRKQRQQKDSNPIVEYDTVSSDSARGKKCVKRSDGDAYVNSTALQTELKASGVTGNSLYDYVEDNSAVYCNQAPLVRQKTEHEILIADLEAYVRKSLANKDYLEKQFQTIPYGLHHPTKDARKPGNAGKNRYKAMYAYDHSRVVLETLEDQTDTDYINASYIKGHIKDKAYIASQGPVDYNMNDFWRMIWEKDIHMIVMTTNLMEETKMKCNKYWPEEADTSMRYGVINVYLESEDVFAEFTIRYLRVYHQDRPNMQRNMKQFHYAAWPDKDVPRSTSNLLQFWYKVRKNDANKMNTWLVHCSSGGGRTGTFIAIDILYDQGRDHGSVDMYQCVTDLSEQRVNMVQTKEQYTYLHRAMVEALVLLPEHVPCDDYHKVYTDLLYIDRNTGKTKLWLQYETMLGETNVGIDTDDNDDIYSSARATENIHKNRYNNTLAMNEFRPCLFTHVTGCSNYINAVYIPSYRDVHGFILTQTPLKNTAVDSCRLVYEQEVKVIVTFDYNGDEEVGTYLPATGSLKLGPFSITVVSEQKKQHFTKRTHMLKYNSKEHTITQLEFNHWPTEKVTPADPNTMLEFLQEIEYIHRQTGNTLIIAQCLNGAERSGLVVVMMNILERARFEREVSIAQVIRQLRIMRPQIIPNVEQYKFCHDVFLSYVESNATYSNI